MKRFFARLTRENATSLREYESFASALRDSDSYEDPRLIEIVQEKTRRYRDELTHAQCRTIGARQLIQNMFVLTYIEPQRAVNVLEIGGACGASYYEAKHLLPVSIQHWAVVETPAMAAAGASLNDDPALSFHTNIEAALQQLPARDLAIVQGTLQYVPEPLRLLGELFERGANYVYVTRTPVTTLSTQIFTRQETDLAAHGPGKLPQAAGGKSSQPLTLLARDALFAAIPSSYETVFTFNESEEQPLAIGARSVAVRDVGFLARKRVYS